MQKACKKFRLWGLMLLAMLFVAGLTTHAASTEVQAAVKNGFRTVKGKTYYVKNGKKYKGWLTLNGKKYYFDKKTGVQQKGWMTSSTGKTYYFKGKTGEMATGWVRFPNNQRRYFNKKSGVMKKGWLTLNGYKYYLNTKTGVALTGFATDSKKVTRYFSPKNGRMAKGWAKISGQKYYFNKSTGARMTGLKKISGKYYYFYPKNGIMATGWVTGSSGAKRYFDPSTGVMATGTKTINGKQYSFKSNGLLIVPTDSENVDFEQPSSAKTIKNYLLGALQPVGQALYVWGGGWNDSTRKGVSPTWKKWYDSQSGSYDYNNYRDLSTANRAKGLDCSGFVGWSAYQVMQQKSGVGYGYTVVAAEVGSYYKSLGWGSIVTQSSLSKSNWTLKAGDVGYNSGHTWIVIGQCSDKSAVIVHSTPQAGCQISGTPTPSGNYSSQAITLAKKYMSKFAGYTKYDYHTSSGNYIRNGNYLRWNRNTLADPDGYLNKTADQILADLFK